MSLLDALFTELRSKSHETRTRAASDLRNFCLTSARELSGEPFIRLSNDINKRIFELIHAQDSNERIGGIMAIERLIDVDTEEDTTKITRFANYLRIVLPSNDVQAMVLASKALGKLAIPGGTLTSDFVEFEVKRALEWLQVDRQENKRFAAVLVLQELARNSPTLVYSYVGQILDLVWVALRDSKVMIREAAASALSACLDIIYQRESQLRLHWYVNVLDEAQHGLKIGTSDAIHGSMLAYRELLLRAGMFMHERFHDVCEIVMRYKDHRDPLIRRSVTNLIPTLAAYNPADFSATYLHKCMLYLLSLLRKERDRSSAFIAIGHIAIAVGSATRPYLDSILTAIKEGLQAKGKLRSVQEAPIFQCLSMLATAVGQALTKHMHELLDMIFACGLSEPLRQALVDLAHYIPPLLATIQDRLLDMLSMILSGRPFRPPGSPNQGQPMALQIAREYREKVIGELKESELVALALNSLGTFDFSGHVLNEFVRDCAISYVEDEIADVRKAAALTCCQLFVRDPICHQTSNHAIEVVSEVLEKLLTVGIADPDPSIRQVVLMSLDERFDRHLAQAENIRSLFIALNDEVFVIREVAISIIGRLTRHNPAYVMPSLRKTLIQLLTELQYSTVGRNKEESAKLLSLLVAAAQSLIKPYVDPMVKVLLPKARDSSATVSSSVMTAIGELTKAGGEDLLQYIPELLPLIIETLQDQSSPSKRVASLRTMGNLASNSGYVIEPYLRYPQLLSILINFLKTEQSLTIRRETVKLMGILGALDPYRHQIQEQSPEETADQSNTSSDVTLLMTGLGPSSEEYYPTVVVNTLMNILRDPSLGSHNTAVIQAIMYIFKTLGLKCVLFLPQIIPGFLSVMRTCTPSMLEFYFQQLGILVSIVKQHIRNYLSDIFKLVLEFWQPPTNLHVTILGLIESIARAIEGEFKVHLPILLPQMLQLFETDRSPSRVVTQKVLHAFLVFGSNIEEYIHLILPVIVRLFEKNDAPISLRKSAIQTVGQLARRVNLSDHASRIIHPLARILRGSNQELRLASMDTLCALVFQLGFDYMIFVPMINKCLVASRIQHSNYEQMVSKLLKGEPLPQDLSPDDKYDSRTEEVSSAESAARKLPVNQEHLKSAWEASQRSTKDDWQEWIRRLSVELLKESPSHALRACASLAGVYYPLARELFNAGFVSCWTELFENYQEELVRSIETALVSPNIPPEILQTLLNLAEFMEHDDKALPIDIRTLGAYARKCHAYAKALHYKELEFIQEPSTSAIEALISINNQLQQSDAAVGILTHAQQHHNLQLKETWYEKLHRWEDALAAYEQREQTSDSFEVTMGKMRCLHALGEWDVLSQLAQDKWNLANAEIRRSIAPLSAAAAWGLGQWELMDDYISVMKPEAPDRAFFKAIICLHRNHFESAALHITKARDLLDTELTALVGESYNRAYGVAVRVQMLAELEEIITYKQSSDLPEKQQIMRKTWMKRLLGCQRNVEVWQRMLKVRALVVTPKESMDMWIKFANLCRKSGRMGLAEKSLNLLLGEDESIDELSSGIRAPPQVVYAYLKYNWAAGRYDESLALLSEFTTQMSQDLGVRPSDLSLPSLPEEQSARANLEEYTKLLARCYLKQGEWHVKLQPSWDEKTIDTILRSYFLATHYDKDWYKAWHLWALANFEVVQFYERENELLDAEIRKNHVIAAIRGFFRSIALSSGKSLQDTLRLLTLWFKHGGHQDVIAAISEAFASVSIDIWLEVIPQLIARIHEANPSVRKSIHQLLLEVGRAHPQAIIYPLVVASKSQSVARHEAALNMMNRMRTHSATLIDQAVLVSQELIRVAILWHEQWHEGLEEASRLYFGDKNIEAMFATLEPLHEMLERVSISYLYLLI